MGNWRIKEIPKCILITAINLILFVVLFTIKNGYPGSNITVRIPTIAKTNGGILKTIFIVRV
ncbi:hypothetical protein W5A_13400 [Imtechella halotolerans K1]|uniref:Uncharacterized protein n=1 Tax=Imtechella halotolerans K1 TaxID=946077 RepID=I0W5J0_9FLAO|nr:hypothetical protein W5A_13400 [Imtechella halotolerans K1]